MIIFYFHLSLEGGNNDGSYLHNMWGNKKIKGKIHIGTPAVPLRLGPKCPGTQVPRPPQWHMTASVSDPHMRECDTT